MIQPIPETSAPTQKAEASPWTRRLRPIPAAPARRDPRADGCIEERLAGGITASACACIIILPFAGEEE